MSVFSQLDLTLIEFNLKKIGVTAHLENGGDNDDNNRKKVIFRRLALQAQP